MLLKVLCDVVWPMNYNDVDNRLTSLYEALHFEISLSIYDAN